MQRHVRAFAIAVAVAVACGCDAPPDTPADARVDAMVVDAVAATDLGVSSDVGRPDAGGPDARTTDVRVVDASLVDRVVEDVSPWTLVPADCARTVDGVGTFARRMGGHGMGTVAPYGSPPTYRAEHRPDVTLAFPAGRVAGADALLSYPVGWPINGTLVLRATLDASRGARFTGHLLAYPSLDLVLHPDGSLDGEMGFNVGHDDVAVLDPTAVAFCVVGDVPPPTASRVVRIGDPPIAPDAPLRFTSSAPVASGTTVSLRATGGTREVPLRVTTTERGFYATPERAFLFGASLTFSDLAATDDIARPFALTETPAPRVLETTATLADRDFDGAPPAGAIVSDGARFRVERGVLSLETNPLFFSGFREPGALLVGLGDVGASRRARLEFTSPGSDFYAFHFRWIAADGAIVDAGEGAWRGDDAGRRLVFDATLPAGGAWWLSITDGGREGGPGPPPPMFESFELDAIVIE